MKRILQIALVTIVVGAVIASVSMALGRYGYPTWSTNKVVAYAPYESEHPYATYEGDLDGMSGVCWIHMPGDTTTSTVIAYDLSLDESRAVVTSQTQDQYDAQIQIDELIVSEQRDDQWGLYYYNKVPPITSELITETAGGREIDMKDGVFAFSGVPGAVNYKGTEYTPPTPPDPPKESKVEDYAVGSRIIFGSLDDPQDLTVLNTSGTDAKISAADLEPSVSNGYVAYHRISGEDESIRVQSLSDPTDVAVVASGTTPLYSPSLSGDIVAWLEWNDGDGHWSLRGYDLSKDEPIDFRWQPGEAPEDIAAYTVDVDGTQIYVAAPTEGYFVAAFDAESGVGVDLDYTYQETYGYAAANGQFMYAWANSSPQSGVNVAYISQPQFHFDTSEYVRHDGRPMISGWITDQGVGVGTGKVQLQSSIDGLRWTTEASATPDDNGNFWLKGSPITGRGMYRLRYTGSESLAAPYWPLHLSTVTFAGYVCAQPNFGSLSAPNTLHTNQSFVSRGNIWPNQLDEHASGRFEVYKRRGGHWCYVGSRPASFGDGTYSARLGFTTPGQYRWRLRFYGSDTNYAGYGPWKTKTVK